MVTASDITNGIGPRPVYDYAPGAEFFDAGTPTGAGVFNVLDYGAVADAAVDNRSMIQAAIEAAFEDGGGIVYIPPGTFGIAGDPTNEGSIQVYSNVFLKGAGAGQTTLRLVDGSTGDITGLVRSPWGEETSNWGIADFKIDGNQENTTGKVDGFFTGPVPGQTISDADVYVTRMEITQVSRYGFDPHELTERLSITDSVAFDNGVDGFVFDRISGGEFTGNVAYGNARHGFNVVTTSQDLVFTDNVSHDNGGAGFVLQRGSENIEAPHNIVITGGESFGNGREGILIQMAEDVLITGVNVFDNDHSGVRLFGSKNVTVENNEVHDNSQAKHDGYSEVDIENYNDTVYGLIHEATGNQVTGNTIYSQSAVQSRYGIEEADDIASNANSINGGDAITGTARGGFSIASPSWDHHISGSNSDDTVIGTSGRDYILAGNGDDEISGKDGYDHIEAGDGNDTVVGGKGNDYIEGGNGNDVLDGGSHDDTLLGGAGDDVLNGGSGNDVLLDGAGADRVLGGSGDDAIAVSDDRDDDFFNGGSGNDLLDLRSVNVGLDINASKKTITGAGNDTFKSFEEIRATYLDDTYRGNDRANTFNAEAGDDQIRGAGGADTLTGGAGDDTYLYFARDLVDRGGNHRGVDTITDYEAGDIIDLANITRGDADAVRLSLSQSGVTVAVNINGTFQDVALLQGVQDVGIVNVNVGSNVFTGSEGDDIIIGGNGDDELHGAGGNDIIKGKAGVDKLFGEAGDDTLRGGDGNDAFNGGAGNDDMRGGSGNDGFFGGGGNDYIKGDSGNDTAFGDGGNDTLIGGSGLDVLYGGSGADTLRGGRDDDKLFGQNDDDLLKGNSGNDQLDGGAGNDRLFGQKGNDTLDGGAGDDFISGGSGDDIIFASAGTDVMDGDGGYDTLDFSNLNAGADINASTKTATGPLNTTFDSIEKFVGSDFNDNFRGSDKVNTLNAGAGDDTIRSAGGADILTGGQGDDTYIYFARDVVDGSGNSRGVDEISDYAAGDVLDLSDIAKGDATAVQVTTDGTNATVAAQINGTFQDVAVLGGVTDVANVSVLIGDELFA